MHVHEASAARRKRALHAELLGALKLAGTVRLDRANRCTVPLLRHDLGGAASRQARSGVAPSRSAQPGGLPALPATPSCFVDVQAASNRRPGVHKGRRGCEQAANRPDALLNAPQTIGRRARYVARPCRSRFLIQYVTWNMPFVFLPQGGQTGRWAKEGRKSFGGSRQKQKGHPAAALVATAPFAVRSASRAALKSPHGHSHTVAPRRQWPSYSQPSWGPVYSDTSSRPTLCTEKSLPSCTAARPDSEREQGSEQGRQPV